jgi:hypothetical protein
MALVDAVAELKRQFILLYTPAFILAKKVRQLQSNDALLFFDRSQPL